MNTNKQTGDTTMNESYKDKFNATMKQFGIDSLDDLKSDDEKKKFFKAVDKSHDAVNESVTDELMAIAEEMKEGGPGSGPQGNPQFGKRKFGSNKKTGPIAKALGKIFKKKAPAKLDYKRMDTTSGDDFESDEFGDIGEMMKEMMKEMAEMAEMKMLKAETDPTKVEMMKKEMMKEMMSAMKKIPEMSEMSETMKKVLLKGMSKKMNEYGSMNAMKEVVTEILRPGSGPGASKTGGLKLSPRRDLKKPLIHTPIKTSKSGYAESETTEEGIGDYVKQIPSFIKSIGSKSTTTKFGKDSKGRMGTTSTTTQYGPLGHLKQAYIPKEVKEDISKYVKNIAFGLNKALGSKQLHPDVYRKQVHNKRLSNQKPMKEAHVPGHQETAVNAMAMNAMRKETARKEMMVKAMKMPIRAMKTGDDDMTPDALKLNAMIKDPHKSKGDDPKKDMNATYMKSDVRGDVKNGGGTDMAKVNDNPKPMAAMKKINAMYKTEKYLDEKPGSIQNVVAEMYQTGKLKG